MPREIVTLDGSSFRFRDYELPPPGPQDVRARIAFAAPKHGTESHAITGSPLPHWEPSLPRARGADKRVDPALLFRDLPIPLAHPNPLRGIEEVLQCSM